MNGSLFPAEVLAAARARYEQAHPPQPSRAEILCTIAREDRTVTVAELAEASGRSASWVRKTLRQAGIVLAKPPRRPRQEKHTQKKSGASLPCRCGHRRDKHCDTSCTHQIESPIGRSIGRVEHCLVCGCLRFQGPQKANQTTPCGNEKCGHPKHNHCANIPRKAGGQGPHAHHLTPAWFQCLTNHCTVFHYHDGKFTPCDCLDYVDPYAKPARAKHKKTILSQEGFMGLIPETDLERSRQKYAAEQAQLEAERQSQQSRTHAEILVEIVREDPALTVAELAEAAGRSHSWVWQTLKAAGLKAAKAPSRQSARSSEMADLC